MRGPILIVNHEPLSRLATSALTGLSETFEASQGGGVSLVLGTPRLQFLAWKIGALVAVAQGAIVHGAL